MLRILALLLVAMLVGCQSGVEFDLQEINPLELCAQGALYAPTELGALLADRSAIAHNFDEIIRYQQDPRHAPDLRQSLAGLVRNLGGMVTVQCGILNEMFNG